MTPTQAPALVVDDIAKSYYSAPAVDGISFEVYEGKYSASLGRTEQERLLPCASYAASSDPTAEGCSSRGRMPLRVEPEPASA